MPDNGGQSRAGWTPYGQKKLRGRVETVVLRGEVRSYCLMFSFLSWLMGSLVLSHDVIIRGLQNGCRLLCFAISSTAHSMQI